MAKELDAILDHGEAEAAVSCLTDDGSAKFLEKIICPIYETLAAVSCFIDPQHNAVIYFNFCYACILLNCFVFVCWNECDLICC
jgi:hypothetical protein